MLKFFDLTLSKALLLSFGSSPDRRDEYEDLMRKLGLEPTWVDLKESLPDLKALKDTLIVLTGGLDIHPARWGEEVIFPELERPHPERDDAEFKVMEMVISLKAPLLGICRGAQVINVFFGGTLFHDIAEELSPVITLNEAHLRVSKVPPSARRRFAHRLYLSKGTPEEVRTILNALGGHHKGYVTSRHHQGLRKLGEGVIPVAHSDDGIIEAVYHSSLPILGVQWHPESPLPEKYRRLMEEQKRREEIERKVAEEQEEG